MSKASPVAVITGTTHGIGRIVSRELARAGYAVFMLCRDVPAGAALGRELAARFPRARLSVLPCDLAQLASVRECAAALTAAAPRIDLLINNAGTVSLAPRRSADGFELTFAVNHLGPFLLTGLLLPQLAPQARIVNTASRIHFRAGRCTAAAVTDPGARYRSREAYARSKLANVQHTFALARRLESTGISVNCLHPGVVSTNLLPRWLRLLKPFLSAQVFDAERGAHTTLHLALDARVGGRSGLYFDEYQRPQPAAPLAQDVALQEELWQMSCDWVGLPRALPDLPVRH
ncbi:MAG: SDR family NAD(P)-dependent oxidoreductase [Proteobacteria bacterium]|nr:SDR family NAD(P)-dependent oxidoreductase [Pseudomonadota bacterium]